MLWCFFLGIALFAQAEDVPCLPRDFGNGASVCVCNDDHCDTIAPVEKLEQFTYKMYSSNKAGVRFEASIGSFEEISQTEADVVVTIDPKSKFQEMLGFGGAFHDSAGINIQSLGEKAKDNLMRSYFSPDGIEYSLCRVPIGGTDFSTHGYSYNDGDEDKSLSNFKLAPEDHLYKLPLIKEAHKLTNGTLKLLASVWTAPKWMKTNNAYVGIGFLKDEMYQVWADYFLKFLDHYASEGVQFWGVTTQNEPSLSYFPEFLNKINSVAWIPSQMIKWVSKNLGPTLRNSSFANIKLICFDDQRIFLPWFVDILFESISMKNFVDGISYHWYYNHLAPAGILTELHEKYPDKFIISGEACEGSRRGEEHVILGSWERGENYFNDIIENSQNWLSAWLDWGIALDTQGGPTYISNFVDSPIIVNATAGEFYKQPMFYAMGHFSKFVPPGSVRISSDPSDASLQVVAFLRPDNGIVVTVLNRKDIDIALKIKDVTRGEIDVIITKRSFNTILYW